MNIENLKHVFFIGIGGIGMSALARYFNERNVAVSGYDKTKTTLTEKLVSEGIEVHYEDDISLIPEFIELVVYTPAIPDSNKQLRKLKRSDHIQVLKRSEVLGLISRSSDAIAVAGTHGKTTTSAMLAHMLRYSGVDISAFVGGIMSDYDSNYFSGKSNWVVLEADEYDRSFLHLYPEVSILQSMDADHLDIYQDHSDLVGAFESFVCNTEFGGKLIINHQLKGQFSDEKWLDLKSKYKIVTYGFDRNADAVITSCTVDGGMSKFELKVDGSLYEVALMLPGDHNRMNACAAILAAREAGCSIESAVSALAVFKGIKRRFEYVIRRDVTYVDDYAHHPSEIDAVLKAVQEVYKGKKVLGIFQPHLYSRTKDFYKEFAQSLESLDEVILMDIYPARELPIKGVDSNLILKHIKNKQKNLLTSDEILERVKEKDFDIVMTLGAGDIDLLVPKIKEIIARHG